MASLRAIVFVCLASALGGCGNSADVNLTSPTFARCVVTANAPTAQVPAAGGSGTLAIDTERECSWSATAEASWITLSDSRGQGPAKVTYSVAANPENVTRHGAVVVGQQRIDIAQEAAPCRYELSPAVLAVPAAGGPAAVTITTGSNCRWTVQNAPDWARPDRLDGMGTATVRFEVGPNTGPARSSSPLFGDVEFTLTQAGAAAPVCSYQVAPGSLSLPAAGGQLSFNVAAPPGCAWTAAATASWISVVQANGVGNGAAGLSIGPNDGPTRAASVVVAGQAVTVTQAGRQLCSNAIKPTYYNAGPGPDDPQIVVTADVGCAWTVTGDPSWVTVAQGRNGTGTGTVRLTIPANAGGPRRATLMIAGQSFELSQGGSCEGTLKPTYYNAGRGPDEFEVSVTINAGCAWTASSPADWATIHSGQSGSGNGIVVVRVKPNTESVSRTVALTIAGQRFTLNQERR